MWQHGTVLESTEAIANSVITKFQPLEFWQLGKTFERGKANVDQAQWLQVDVFITQTFNLCGTRIVEIQFFNLERKSAILLQSVCRFSTFFCRHIITLHFHIYSQEVHVWRDFDASDRAGTSCATSGPSRHIATRQAKLNSHSQPISFTLSILKKSLELCKEFQ